MLLEVKEKKKKEKAVSFYDICPKAWLGGRGQDSLTSPINTVVLSSRINILNLFAYNKGQGHCFAQFQGHLLFCVKLCDSRL